jgi:hypothetical protein
MLEPNAFDGYDGQKAVFPLDVLRPGEAVVYPLRVSLIPHLDASSLLNGLSSGGSPEDKYDETLPSVELLSSTGQRELEVRPAYELEKVEFHVADESDALEATRPMNEKDLLQVNKSCECGSCPLLFWHSRNGHWLRAREFLTDARGPAQVRTITFAVPAGVDAFRIDENAGEVTTMTGVDIVVRSATGRVTSHRLIRDSSITVRSGSAFMSDLRAFASPNARLSLRLRGYYVPQTAVVCPYVFPLPKQLIEQFATSEPAR